MNSNNNKPGKGNKNIKFYIVYFLSVLVMVTVFNYFANDIRNQKQNYNEFQNAITEDRVKSIKLDESQRKFEYTMVDGDELAGFTLYTGYIPNDEEIVQLIKEKNIPFEVATVQVANPILSILLSWVLPLGLLLFLGNYIMKSMDKRGGGMMSFGKNTAKLYESDTGVTFRDVAGQEEAKESLVEIVDFLHNPKKYVEIGAKLPKGALLVGPPGTGKTLLAKAVAGEAKVPFFSLSGSAFVEMFVGMGAARVRDLFKEAMAKAPCIIFIDEIDAIGKSRETGGYGGNDEREQTLNQLLAEMDGFDSSKGIVLLAATNRPEVLDKALLRPGRFDRRIIVDAPDLKGREAILKVHAKDVKMGDDVNLLEIAKGTPGAVGADLANMINEAALRAVKNGRAYVMQEDLQESIELVIAGQQKKDRIMSPKEKRIVAFHEIGHALVAAMQKNTDPVMKITIVPRTMGALGYTMQVPEDDKYLMSKEEMLTEITILFGGRAAEEVEFKSITTGASNDIERATNMARRMVTLYGMSDTFDMMASESVRNQYLDGRTVMNVSDRTAAKVDEETLSIIKACHKKAIEILEEHKDLMRELSEVLLDKETITGHEFMEVVRRTMGNDFGLTKAEMEERAKKAEAEKANDEAEVIHVDEEPSETVPAEESKELDE
ncbi:ATP-dependent zinc metalloprotease FtsH [Proteiniclasticum ruminis]|uniref:ATP-dependent zinc metalloprotease FtsH n=1 Tax=Proteiniclasticum ruminis TaxID=398199 RepID=A0A1I5DVC6_9CLOT|nr:ATP-dependent zinc metalloprotease FtsH [Proteiniclasticum ruminis]SFO03060.1 membrane protease FtsH catalytic subunit [Proteiniclasticum ruminis]